MDRSHPIMPKPILPASCCVLLAVIGLCDVWCRCPPPSCIYADLNWLGIITPGPLREGTCTLEDTSDSSPPVLPLCPLWVSRAWWVANHLVTVGCVCALRRLGIRSGEHHEVIFFNFHQVHDLWCSYDTSSEILMALIFVFAIPEFQIPHR